MVAQVIPDKLTDDLYDADPLPEFQAQLYHTQKSLEQTLLVSMHSLGELEGRNSTVGRSSSRRSMLLRQNSSVVQMKNSRDRIVQDARIAGLDEARFAQVDVFATPATSVVVTDSLEVEEDIDRDDQAAQFKEKVGDLQQWIQFLQEGHREPGARSVARLRREIDEAKRRILSKRLLEVRRSSRRTTFTSLFVASDNCQTRRARFEEHCKKLLQKCRVLVQISSGYWTPDVTKQMNVEEFSQCCDTACVSHTEKKAHSVEMIDLTARALGKTNTLFFQFFPPVVLISKFAEAMNDPAPYPPSYYRKGTLLVGNQPVMCVFAKSSPRVSPKWSKRGEIKLVEFNFENNGFGGAPSAPDTDRSDVESGVVRNGEAGFAENFLTTLGFGGSLCACDADEEAEDVDPADEETNDDEECEESDDAVLTGDKSRDKATGKIVLMEASLMNKATTLPDWVEQASHAGAEAIIIVNDKKGRFFRGQYRNQGSCCSAIEHESEIPILIVNNSDDVQRLRDHMCVQIQPDCTCASVNVQLVKINH